MIKSSKYLLGSISNNTKEEWCEALDWILENIFEIEYENQIQNDTRNFANGMMGFLENEM